MAQTSNWTATAEENSIQAERNIINIEKMNEETTNTLKRAMDYIQTEGAAALSKAISKSDELGQQSDQMSEIARDARQYVDVYVHWLYCSINFHIYDYYEYFFFFRKETEIEKMRATAEKAIDVSTEAYEITRLAVNQQKNIRWVQ